MSPEKAPGVDGFSAIFYQRFWNLVKEAICREVLLSFLNEHHLDQTLNMTQIVLIPKKERSDRVEDFRPISLCNDENYYKDWQTD